MFFSFLCHMKRLFFGGRFSVRNLIFLCFFGAILTYPQKVPGAAAHKALAMDLVVPINDINDHQSRRIH